MENENKAELRYEWKHPKLLKSVDAELLNEEMDGLFYISKTWMEQDYWHPYFYVESSWFPISKKPFRVKRIR